MGTSCYTHPHAAGAANGPDLSQPKARLHTDCESSLLDWQDHDAEPAPAWGVTPSVLPCFQSANCFLHELSVYKPGCFCRSTVTLCCSTAQLLAKSLPATPMLPEPGAHTPAPKALLQALFLWSQVHNVSPPVANVGLPRYTLAFTCPRQVVIKGQGNVKGDHKRTFAVKWGNIRMTLLSLMLVARCGCLGQI